MRVYFNSEFADRAGVFISPDNQGFVFGDEAYERLRARAAEIGESVSIGPEVGPVPHLRAMYRGHHADGDL
jgi:hypothetical protein